MVVGLAGVADDAVATISVRTELVVAALADDTEAVGVVDVQESVVRAGEVAKRRQVERVARHAVHAVDADQAWRRAALLEQALQVLRVLED